MNIPSDQGQRFFGLNSVNNLRTSFNVAPSQTVPVIRGDAEGGRALSEMNWGLIPSWAKDPVKGLINARCETAHEKPSFKHALSYRRCIIPASGFYEWCKVDGQKSPSYIHMVDGSPMPLAGIWESWRSPEGEMRETFAILTTTANSTVAMLHDRMPVILHHDELGNWLDRQMHDCGKLSPLFKPYPADRVTSYPVSTLVNSPANDGPECIKPLH